jgi:Uncharacterized protein conserved in bacteria (DUF2330)
MQSYLSPLVILLAALAIPRAAHACGGLFCDRPPPGPSDLPVAQTAENVLFAMDRNAQGSYSLEAHIQIFYTGPASKFSWVVPVDAMPTLDVGSNAVFQVLDAATRPKVMVTRRREGVCSDDVMSLGQGGSSSKKDGGAGPPGIPDSGGVDVTFRGAVGPFDAVVVRADDPGRLKAWLAENMYYLSDQGSQLIDGYVQEQKFFVALKLLPGKQVNQIRPIVLRFEGRGPCVPLRLTAVAALPDLRVNLWVLAQHRVVPENYFEIAINEAKFDWLGGGRNYQDLLKAAANEAGGNAFAVEYVGPTTPLGGTLFPMPAGYDAERAQVTSEYSPARYPGMSLDEFLEAQLLGPRRRAQTMFDSHPKLTRLVTFISPDEMNLDPTFIENSTLPDVSNVRTAVATLVCGAREFSSCNAPMRVGLPDGRSLYVQPANDGSGWCGPNMGGAGDRTPIDQMPALDRAWKREAIGDGALRFDNRAMIDTVLDAQKKAALGCGCALGGRASAHPFWLAALALLLLRRRWRR